MIAKNRIWEELKQAKANIICIQRYTDRGRCLLRAIDSLIIAFSTAGALGSLIDIHIAVLGVSIVALTSILKTTLSGIAQSEQEFTELDRLMDFYSKYMNDIERIWYEFNEKEMTESEMIHKLFEIKNDECNRYSLLNKLVRSIPEKEQKKIDIKSEEYINRVYFNKFESNE
ncbi:MAG: hypothetical protein LBV72_10200 [Tannerella sp.]|jgi:hypothetical protein|nr:hypothetical protein [Tannerella sp.]